MGTEIEKLFGHDLYHPPCGFYTEIFSRDSARKTFTKWNFEPWGDLITAEISHALSAVIGESEVRCAEIVQASEFLMDAKEALRLAPSKEDTYNPSI